MDRIAAGFGRIRIERPGTTARQAQLRIEGHRAIRVNDTTARPLDAVAAEIQLSQSIDAGTAKQHRWQRLWTRELPDRLVKSVVSGRPRRPVGPHAESKLERRT